MSFMRFRWIAEAVNARGEFLYELYRPWRRYDALVLVKSMSDDCLALARKAKKTGIPVIFDANVDYYTVPEKTDSILEALPSDRQRDQAKEITTLADGVMASSRHLAEICSRYSTQKTQWIPDNVNFSLVPALASGQKANGPLHVWWSGMPQKLFEFLSIDRVLRTHGDRLHLHLVTLELSALRRWPMEMQKDFDALLSDIPHTIHGFTSVTALLRLYSGTGGIIVSPRYLETP